MAEISSKKDLRAWLEDRPLETSRIIAHRTAARVMPLIGQDVGVPVFRSTWRAILTKRTLRCALAARLVCIAPSAPRTSAATAAAPAAASDAAFFAAATATAATAATATAATAAAPAAASDAAFFAAATATATTAAAAAAIWGQITRDCDLIEAGRDILHVPLWHGEAPDWAKEAWQDLQAFLRGDDENWQFWLDFYEGILRGDQYSPAQLDLMDEIAQMPEEDWDKPAEQVNAIVAEKYKAFQTVQGQDLLGRQTHTVPASNSSVFSVVAHVNLLSAARVESAETSRLMAIQIRAAVGATRAASNHDFDADALTMLENFASKFELFSDILVDKDSTIDQLKQEIDRLHAQIKQMGDGINDVSAPSMRDTLRFGFHNLVVGTSEHFGPAFGSTAGYIAPVAGLYYIIGNAALVLPLVDAATKFIPKKGTKDK